MNPIGIPEQDTVAGPGIPEQDLPENQDPDVQFVVDGMTGEKHPIGEPIESPPRVQSSSAESDLMESAAEPTDEAEETIEPSEDEPSKPSADGTSTPDQPVKSPMTSPAEKSEFAMPAPRPKSGPGSRGPYKKTK